MTRHPDPSTQHPDPNTRHPDPTLQPPDPSTLHSDPTLQPPDPTLQHSDPTPQPPGPTPRHPDPTLQPAAQTRRGMMFKLGLLFNGAVGVVLAAPILRYLLSPMIRERDPGYDSWLALGPLDQFPQGQTRLANFRNPIANADDGETAKVPCWVRNIDGDKLQVFAINCAHLGCPVRWFPQSGLFMCPCHGGAYYADGSRAAGPPERGLFEYPSKVERGNLMIRAGEMPTPGSPTARLINIDLGKPPCAG